jgi:hypothetical protein
MDRNAGAPHYLLGSQSQIARPCGSADFDEDVAMVTEMNEMFAFGGGENITLPRGGLSRGA